MAGHAPIPLFIGHAERNSLFRKFLIGSLEFRKEIRGTDIIAFGNTDCRSVYRNEIGKVENGTVSGSVIVYAGENHILFFCSGKLDRAVQEILIFLAVRLENRARCGTENHFSRYIVFFVAFVEADGQFINLIGIAVEHYRR